jgi:hypothetical protein
MIRRNSDPMTNATITGANSMALSLTVSAPTSPYGSVGTTPQSWATNVNNTNAPSARSAQGGMAVPMISEEEMALSRTNTNYLQDLRSFSNFPSLSTRPNPNDAPLSYATLDDNQLTDDGNGNGNGTNGSASTEVTPVLEGRSLFMSGFMTNNHNNNNNNNNNTYTNNNDSNISGSGAISERDHGSTLTISTGTTHRTTNNDSDEPAITSPPLSLTASASSPMAHHHHNLTTPGFDNGNGYNGRENAVIK